MIVIILLIIIAIYFYYSEYNTMRFGQYHIHRTSTVPNDSLVILQEIDRRIIILKDHLNKKYGCETCPYIISNSSVSQAVNIISQYNMRERMQQLSNNYTGAHLYEISPNNITGDTSFTEGKGRKIVMCLRSKSGDLHDINTIMFVALHEITHVMNDRWGHETYFWDLFKIILVNAVECRIYTPVDYASAPVTYCGLQISQNPLYI